MAIQIEVCQRLMDHKLHPVLDPQNGTYKMEQRPTYHAQIANQPGIWAGGATADEAIGDLIRHHAEAFGIEVILLEGRLPR